MNPCLSDPNNHVPEVSPDDSWGDPELVPREPVSAATVLPARRTLCDPSPSATHAAGGLRIEAHPVRVESADTLRRIEVQEITGDVIRLDPEIEAPPKIERQFTFHEKPVSEKQQKKNAKKLGTNVKRIHPRGPRWILAMGVTVTVTVVSSLMMLPAINAPNAPRADAGKMVLNVVEEPKIEGMESLNVLLEQQPEALQIFRSYAQASGIDEITPMVRSGKPLRETLRAHWKPLGLPKSWIPAADSTWDVMSLGGRPFGQLTGDFPDRSKFTAYFTNEDGGLLLDWKATVGFGTASFEQLGTGSGDASEIRGELSNAQYYNAAWPEVDYRSYSLTSPDQETTIWCYVRRGESTEDALGSLFNSGIIIGESKSVQKVTVHLARGPEQSLPNQWLVRELLQIDWVTR